MEPELSEDLLAYAALLEWFDEAALLYLLPDAGPAIAALLAGDAVAPVPDRPGAFTMRDHLRAEQRRKLWRASPRGELELCMRLFRSFCTTLGRAEGSKREQAEELAFGLLMSLVPMLHLRQEWQTIKDLIAEAAATKPQQWRHSQRLTAYDAAVAVRTRDQVRGGRMLRMLLDADDLEPRTRLEAMNALGYLHRSQTRYDQALQTYLELARLARHYGDQEYHGAALFNVGSMYNELDQYDQALANVLESKQIFEAIERQDRLAYACFSAGLNAMYLGRWELAREQYGQAIALFEHMGMEVTIAMCYWGQGFLNLLLGDWAASEAAYREAIALVGQSGRGEQLLHMDSWGQLGFLYFTLGRHEEALTCFAEAEALAASISHAHRKTFICYLRGRALAALGRDDEATAAYDEAMDALEALRASNQEEQVKIGVLGTAQQVYEAAALHALARGRAAEAFAIVERACSRALLDSLAARDPELFARYAQPTIALAEAQAALPADALLLVYYTTGVWPSGEHFYHSIPPANVALKAQMLLPPGVILFAITSTSLAVHHLNLDPNILSPQADDPRPGRHLVHERRLAALYERLIGPVEQPIAACASLFIVPHGPLHYVPFMALRSSAALHLVRADGPALALAPSATVLVRNCLSRPAGVGAALAIGYNGAGEARLRFAEPEARLVARALGGRALTGAAASAAALLGAGPLKALHIAGHAAFRPDDPLESALTLAEGERLSARELMGGAGLRAELVVLSACTSGLSQVARGDELLGLQRAWLYAGAAAVVCALWEAGDLVTLLVMERFYANLLGGATPGGALRDALVAVRALTGRELRAIFARWQAEDPALAEPGALPAISSELDETALYAAPIHWAPFMLIGRP